MNVPATLRYTGFYDLLCDAIFQHRLAKECSDPYEMNRHARASVSASALALECAANCLLTDTDIPSALRQDLDRLPLISKYEVSLRIQEANVFERGRPEVQRVAELVKVRNEFVHTRIRNIQSELGPLADQGSVVELPITFDGETWPVLQIPKRPVFWSADSALSVLAAVVSFLSYVLVDLKRLGPDDVWKILVSRVEFDNIAIPVHFDEFISELSGVGEHGIDLGFLGCQKS